MKQNFTNPGSESQKQPGNNRYKKVKRLVLYSLGYIVIKWTVILGIGGALYETGHWNNWYLIAVPIIGITTFIIKRRIKINKNKKKYVDN